MSRTSRPVISLMHLKLVGRTVPFRSMYLGGTFDCLHRGHLELFRNASRVATEVVVGLNTDEFASNYKRPPLQPLEDRMAVLEACTLVDRVVVNVGGADSKPAIEMANVDAIGHGSDWVGIALMHQMGLTPEWLSEHTIQLVYMPYTAGVSSTAVLERARAILSEGLK